jgi:hypothetical protein
MQVVDVPAVITSGTVDQLIWGWTETINAFKWLIEFNEVPEFPYTQPPQVINGNYDFSNSSTGWNAFNGSLSVSGSPPTGGPTANAGFLTPSGSATSAAAEESSAKVPVTLGATYLVEAWVYTAGSSAVELGMDFDDVNGNYISTSTQLFFPSAGAWTFLETLVTVPFTTSITQGYVRCGRNGQGSNVVNTDTTYMENVKIIFPVTVW